MKKLNILTVIALSMTLLIGSASFSQEKMIKETTTKLGTTMMSPSNSIVENLVNSKNHITLVAVLRVSELVKTLQGDGPFTVFAPINTAFKKLPDGTLDTLLKPENKNTLQGILKYHVLSGSYEATDIVKAIEEGNGTATFKTLNGGSLSASLKGKSIILTDSSGNTSTVTIPNVNNANGVIHVIDNVLKSSK